MTAHWPNAALTLALLLTAGCGVAPVGLMPTPLVYRDGALDPFAHAPPDEQLTSLDILYATDREPVYAELIAWDAMGKRDGQDDAWIQFF